MWYHIPPIVLISEEQSFPGVSDVHSRIYFPDFLGKSKFVYVLRVTIHEVVSIQSPHSDPCWNREQSFGPYVLCLVSKK